jgi:dipeptidyl aminopeptidase/acylaminoacyl peptidase
VIVTPTGNQVIVVHKSYSFDWSPDGSRFARVDGDRPESYRLENNVYVLRIADLEPVRLVAGGDRPDWSPDGSAVAFERPLSAAPSPGCWTELRLVTVRTGRQAKLLGC